MKRIIYYPIFIVFAAVIVFSVTYYKISNLQYFPEPAQLELDIEKITFEQGDIPAKTFSKTRIPENEAAAIIKALSKTANLKNVKPGDFYEVLYDELGSWKAVWFYPYGEDFFSVTKNGDGVVTAAKKKLKSFVAQKQFSGKIESSLWDAMSSQGVLPSIIMSFTEIFESQIDFVTDSRVGDEFKVIYETKEVIKKGTVLSARITSAKYKTGAKIYDAFYFKPEKGYAGYYDKNGMSVRSAFLKAPLQYKRISSYFSMARKHPIFKIERPHQGIDYAAPTGTPVSAIGNGIVKSAKRSGGYGNLIIIKHINGYETYYGHLSKYAKGIKKGVSVAKGEVIGYVGQTGTATGPHLDFRIMRYGKFFDFLSMKQRPANSLYGQDKKKFLRLIDDYVEF
ncbi:MAG: M23 family metallopeptidase [Endomicrobium sp.]|jgi:murein DD-endopeptidase MepM/ murein hydrolase activator NlpD|nr:M23 family metallopeptidase [Endomicrobium sp.]